MMAAVAQMTSTAVIRDNLATAASLISRAAAAGAKAVFLPEASDFIATSDEVPRLLKSPELGQFVQGVQDAASQGDVWVSVGVHEPGEAGAENGRVRGWNTQLLIDPQGAVRSAYRKLHLFDVDIKGGLKILESDTTLRGSKLEEPVQTPIGSIGLLTCYDVRFPEVSLSLRRRGASLITYPSAFTVNTGRAHWETLLRARAVETQSYVIGAAQVGQHPDAPKRMSWGAACIVSPWGDVLARCPDQDGGEGVRCDGGTLAYADIDLERLESIRKEMPLWEQRRDDVYTIL